MTGPLRNSRHLLLTPYATGNGAFTNGHSASKPACQAIMVLDIYTKRP